MSTKCIRVNTSNAQTLAMSLCLVIILTAAFGLASDGVRDCCQNVSEDLSESKMGITPEKLIES